MTWNDLIALSPILILALSSAALLLAGAWWPRRQALMGLGCLAALSAALVAGVLEPPTEEISALFSAGPYARYFTLLWSLVAALTLLISLRYGRERRFSAGEYSALVLFAAAGMALLSSAISLVGLFLGLEAFTLVLYILIAFHRREERGAEAALKYLVLGAVATGFLAFGIALIYTSSGTFLLPEALAGLDPQGGLRPLALLGWGMLLVALGFKLSLVPFHLWTPDVYQGAPVPVTGLLATGSKGAVLAVLVTLGAGLESGWAELRPLLGVLCALSLLVGTLCALRQDNLKRLLAYAAVVQMGYLLLALMAEGGAGSGALIFYLTAYVVMSLGVFAVIASFSSAAGEAQALEDYRGLGLRHPLRGAALAVFLLALAGIPPTAGFMGKFVIFVAALEAGLVLLVVVGVVASLISVYYYLRVVIVLFSPDAEEAGLSPARGEESFVIAFCLAATLILGILPGPLLGVIAALIP
ncbi:NADH-quinone oxidoreductase subunit N [Geoalkalibacter halelectricus]|uniref:NADH-quinone oxidoreductase subunit N n=1 Tax=Geoalkalibacter halelectricus TaxID=2847045 RepID=A0ABY5ZLH3_9BACT|nr:NADH-quinone oxidoreductase subunit N [Geoalkalibacter halelectricus]MDO3378695.1 NADH-quinone oxidoreductase subunit N [Geoalkalibacter halelectricus]UWZ79996.1 NADH-quinone oxidoreductase subunit N [Geoalkalibacter halelectricus]